jgi:hypothetical protein
MHSRRSRWIIGVDDGEAPGLQPTKGAQLGGQLGAARAVVVEVIVASSMAQPATGPSPARKAWSSSGGGVVCGLLRSTCPSNQPTVPMRAAGPRPAMHHHAHHEVVVLPLVPPTPTRGKASASACCDEADRRAKVQRALATTTSGSPVASSAMTAAAPRDLASAICADRSAGAPQAT